MLFLIIGKINKLVPTIGKCVPTKKLRKNCVIFLSGGNKSFSFLYLASNRIFFLFFIFNSTNVAFNNNFRHMFIFGLKSFH